jgi:diguanylate cyclase (GGDEF)-like protein
MGALFASRIPKELARIGLIFALTMGVVCGLYLVINDAAFRQAYLDILPPILELGLAVMLFVGARFLRRHSSMPSGSWVIIGIAVLLYAIGDAVWAYLELGMGQRPFPSWADVFYLAYYPVFALGAIRLVFPRITALGRWNLALDLLTIFVAAALVLWNVLIAPVVQSSAGSPVIEQLILWAYPLGDILLLGTLIVIIYYQSEEVELTSTFVLSAGVATMIVTDSIYSYQTLSGAYTSGTPLDFGWLAAMLLTGLAILPPWRVLQQGGADRDQVATRTLIVALGSLRTYMPYGALLISYVLLLRSGLDALSMTPLTLGLGLGGIVALVLLRQFTTHAENAELTTELVSKATQLENTNRYLAVEVTERRRIEEKLSYDTLHDTMTGLPNRTLFLERLAQAIELSRRRKNIPFSVLFIDIDHFKVVNDSLGHLVGDELLWAIGARIKGTLRPTDTLARFGGDEFAILMDVRAHDDAAHKLADRVQRSLQQEFRIEGHELHMTASIGIVADVSSYEHAEDLLRDADLAMYEAKSAGKSRFQTFAVRMRKRAFLRLDMEAELRRALTNRELEVHYQPIVSFTSGRVAGVEALVRWRHPRKGLLHPSEFLTVAEESGLIVRLGEQVLTDACREMRHLQERHRDLRELGVSVNVSNKEFTLPGLSNAVSQALRRSTLDPRALRLEITERVLIGNLRLANRLFHELNGKGIRFDIDDFGTGYSALTYLQNFPIHALKIDQSFIEGMGRSSKALGLVKAIISMAHELGMQAVAEGVSSASQLQDLKELQCDYSQGYLLSKPISAEALGRFLQSSEFAGNGARPATASRTRVNGSKAAHPKPQLGKRTSQRRVVKS